MKWELNLGELFVLKTSEDFGVAPRFLVGVEELKRRQAAELGIAGTAKTCRRTRHPAA
jgi:hypothetical protein